MSAYPHRAVVRELSGMGRAEVVREGMQLTREPAVVISVSGVLSGAALDEFCEQLRARTELVLLDLSQVTGCDRRLFPLLEEMLRPRSGGGLWLVGVSAQILDILDGASLSQVLMVYMAARWPRRAPLRASSQWACGSVET